MNPLQPHQQKAIKQLRNGSILWGDVGSGKSRAALGYYLENEGHRDVYVITTAKKRDTLDWTMEAAALNVDHDKFHVDSWNNIHKYSKVHGAFFIFDEQRVVGRGKWVKSFLNISRKNRWILLSATPGDTWLDYVPVFVANGFYQNRREFEMEHVVWVPYIKYPKVQRYTNVNRLVRYRNQILVHMRHPKETVRHTKMIWCDFDVDLMETVVKKRWNPYLDKPIRDAGELFALMRRVMNSHTSRLEAVEALLRQIPRLIVFYNFNYELEALRALGLQLADRGDDEITFAEWNGHKHEELPETGRWCYLVQYLAGSEGWNCITTDSVLFYSLTPSFKKWEQAHGRIDRINTPYIDLFYYVLRANTPIDTAIWRALKQKKDFNFNDYDIKMLDWN